MAEASLELLGRMVEQSLARQRQSMARLDWRSCASGWTRSSGARLAGIIHKAARGGFPAATVTAALPFRIVALLVALVLVAMPTWRGSTSNPAHPRGIP